MQLTNAHKRIIVAIIMFTMTFAVMLYFDAEITHLFKQHDVNASEVTGNVITVNGDGSSGTGDVTNNQIVETSGGTTYVAASGGTTKPVANVSPNSNSGTSSW